MFRCTEPLRASASSEHERDQASLTLSIEPSKPAQRALCGPPSTPPPWAKAHGEAQRGEDAPSLPCALLGQPADSAQCGFFSRSVNLSFIQSTAYLQKTP
ncbi:hypothetical protein VPH35_043139 [Triticum aestivum]